MKLKYNDWRLFTYLTKYIRPYLWLLILASIALISNLLCSLIRPYLSKQAIDLGFAMVKVRLPSVPISSLATREQPFFVVAS